MYNCAMHKRIDSMTRADAPPRPRATALRERCIAAGCPFFRDDNVCLNHLWRMRYGGLRACPKCHVPSTFHRCHNKRAWACARCAAPISPTAHTIFHKSTTPLSMWFYAISEMSIYHAGISPKELQRRLGCTYKTAWRMCAKIRVFFASGDFSFYFGDPRNPHSSLFGHAINNAILKKHRCSVADTNNERDIDRGGPRKGLPRWAPDRRPV